MNSSTPFRATSDERLELAAWIGREATKRIVCTKFPPSRSVDVPVGSLPDPFENPKSIGFSFPVGRAAPRDRGEGSNAMSLRPARSKRKKIRQPAIGIYSTIAAIPAWKVVRAYVEKMTIAGVAPSERSGPRWGFDRTTSEHLRSGHGAVDIRNYWSGRANRSPTNCFTCAATSSWCTRSAK